ILTCTSAAFASIDVGKAIVVAAAGATSGGFSSLCTVGAPCSLVTTILSQQSATQVTLAANATTTVASNGLVYYGTDDGAAIGSCILNGTLAGGACTVTNNTGFMVSNTASTINFFGLTA